MRRRSDQIERVLASHQELLNDFVSEKKWGLKDAYWQELLTFQEPLSSISPKALEDALLPFCDRLGKFPPYSLASLIAQLPVSAKIKGRLYVRMASMLTFQLQCMGALQNFRHDQQNHLTVSIIKSQVVWFHLHKSLSRIFRFHSTLVTLTNRHSTKLTFLVLYHPVLNDCKIKSSTLSAMWTAYQLQTPPVGKRLALQIWSSRATTQSLL